MNASQLKLGVKSALATGALALATIVVPAAQADIWFNTTGGASCKGSSGFGALNLYFSNTSVQNTRENGQYVTCEIPYGNNNAATKPLQVYVIGNNPTVAAVHYTCALQAGYEGTVVNTAVYEVDVPATNYGYVVNSTLVTVPAIPAPPTAFAPYSVSCLLAPSAKIGLINTQLTGTL